VSALTVLDLRWVTAAVLCMIGLYLIALAIRIWWMPLTRRAELFGPLLTDGGYRALLRSWPIVFLGGMFLLICGVSKFAYYQRWQGDVATEVANSIGVVEAAFSLWVAGSIAVLTVRAWRGR
jgi:hypothetical protein